MAIFRFVAIFGLIFLCSLVLQAQSEEPLVRFEVQLDRTAIWIGDLLEYKILLFYSPEEVEIIRDNLKEEDIHLDPATLLGMSIDPLQTEQGQGLEITLHLTVLESNASELVIPAVSIYYATRQPGSLGQGSDIETHHLIIPERKVGLRSTLTSDSRDIRDFLGIRSSGWLARLMWLPGWLIVGLFAVQGIRWSVTKYQEMAGGAQRIDKKTVEKQALAELNRLESVVGIEELSQRCFEMLHILHGAITNLLEIEGVVALTPQELKEELIKQNAGESVSDRAFKIFEECESLRYNQLVLSDGEKDLSELINSSREVVSQLARL